jgi:hypothetical protein
LYKDSVEHQNKVTMPMLRSELAILSKKLDKAFSVFCIQENSATFHLSLILLRGNRFQKTFIEKVNQMVPVGLIQKSENTRTMAGRTDKQDNDPKPQKLTLEHLGVCFAVILICLALSCSVFMFECVVENFR